MRTLTDIQSSTNIVGEITANILAADASTTWVFSEGDISNVSPISWEIPFTGGLGKTSGYNLTLSTSLGWIKDNLLKLPRSEITFSVIVGSDQFFPHVGRIRQIERNSIDPNLITCQVFDRFLETIPQFPVESLVDSYSTLHPQVLDSDLTFPVYYGKHTRPFFHTITDSNGQTFLGPRNVSSENHVNSVWFSTDLSKGTDINSKHNLLYENLWNQQSGSSNEITVVRSFTELAVRDIAFDDIRLWEVTDAANIAFTTETRIQNIINGVVDAKGGGGTVSGFDFTVNPKFLFNRIGDVFFDIAFSNTTYTNSARIRSTVFVTSINGQQLSEDFISTNINGPPFATQGSADISSDANFILRTFLADGYNWFHAVDIFTNNPSEVASQTTAKHFFGRMQLDPNIYKNFSLFSVPINSSDIAISENPMGVLYSIFSEHTNTPLVVSQNSQAQADVTSFNFQCGFYERQSLDKIMNEFGEITGTNLWIGDSGQVNFRTYQESANANIDATIGLQDMLTFSIRDNPLGSSQFISDKFKRIKVKYGYDFSEQLFKNTLQADPTNTAACNSVSASGIDKEETFKSKYIMETDTASYWLGNLVRRFTNNETIVNMNLPAKFFQLEPADILKVQHPMIIGSESLFQITKLTHDYQRGNVRVQAEELVSL